MKTIVIIRTGGIGDVILSLVSINVIKINYPGAKIAWIGRSPTLELISEAYPEIQTIPLRQGKSYFEHLGLIKNELDRIDLVIDLQRSARSIIISALLFFKYRFKYSSWNKYSLQRAIFVFESRLKGRNSKTKLYKKQLLTRREAMARCTSRALEKINIVPNRLRLYCPELITQATKENKIAICLGALFQLKELNQERIDEFINYLVLKTNKYSLILLGEKNKTEQAKKIQENFGGRIDIINYCGQTSLWEAAKILSQCKFSLANDSALAHLSESVNTPVYMFFGPTHERFGYSPYLDGSRSFSADLGCRPCHKDGNTVCRFNDEKCKTGINIPALFPYIDQMLHA